MDDQQIQATRELIRRLPTVGRDELLQLWQENFGRPAAPGLKRALMLPILAYRIQERVYGGLDEESERRLKEVAVAAKPDQACNPEDGKGSVLQARHSHPSRVEGPNP